MPGPGIALVPFVWNTLQFTTLMGLLYDLDGKVTMDVKQEDLENLDPNLFNSTKEAVREAAIKQHAFDMAGNVEFDENGLPTGNVSFGESNIDITKYEKKNLSYPPDGIPRIPDTDEGYTYDPMDEWFTPSDSVRLQEIEDKTNIGSIFKKIEYITPPEIRKKLGEAAAFVSGGAYKVK